MNYFTVIENIKNISLGIVEEFHEGDVYEYLNSGSHKYPSVIMSVQNIVTEDYNVNRIRGILFCVDRLTTDSSNKLEVQSLCMSRLLKIINKLEVELTDFENSVYTPFTEKFADLCGGMFVEFEFKYIKDNFC